MKILSQRKTVKNILAFVVIAIALTLTGCIVGSGNSTLSSVTVSSGTYPGTLSGQIFDATTGAPISGTGITIELAQGTTIRTPDTLITSSTDPLAGEYGFANIPVEAATVNQFKLAVTVPGYQHFESEFSFGQTLGTNSTSSAPFYNKIGDIYLYPVNATAAPVTITVLDNAAVPVAGESVELLQFIGGNNPTIAQSGTAAATNLSTNILLPTNGLVTSGLTAITDATGKATFPATGLALGAQYIPVVLAMTEPVTGNNLPTTTGTALIEGTTISNQTVVMIPISLATALKELVRSFIPGITLPQSSGKLSVYFNKPFALNNTAATAWTANLYVMNPTASLVSSAAASATASATVVGSNLSITPTITGTLPAAASAVWITYTYSGTATDLTTGQLALTTIFSAAGAGATAASGVTAGAAAGVYTYGGGSVQLQ